MTLISKATREDICIGNFLFSAFLKQEEQIKANMQHKVNGKLDTRAAKERRRRCAKQEMDRQTNRQTLKARRKVTACLLLGTLRLCLCVCFA